LEPCAGHRFRQFGLESVELRLGSPNKDYKSGSPEHLRPLRLSLRSGVVEAGAVYGEGETRTTLTEKAILKRATKRPNRQYRAGSGRIDAQIEVVLRWNRYGYASGNPVRRPTGSLGIG